MLYPISSQDNKSKVVFRWQKAMKPYLKTDGVAILNPVLREKINILKSIYIEMINNAKNNNIFASKMLSGFNNVRIEDSIIIVTAADNKSIKLSMLEVGVSKLFRIKFFENKELKKILTFDDYKLVERVNKKDITYFKKDVVNETELASTINFLYEMLDEPFLEVKKCMRIKSSDVEAPKGKFVKFVSQIEKKEVVSGVTPDMLPISKVIPQENKPLFSYAELIGEKSTKEGLLKEEKMEVDEDQASKIKRRGRPSKEVRLEVEKKENETSVPKRRGRPPKVAKVLIEEKESETITPKRRGRPSKASKVLTAMHSLASYEKNEKSLVGKIPNTFTKKVLQLEELYQEVNDLLKDFSSSKLLQLKQLFNVEINKKRGLYFVEQNGDKLSVAKFNRKNADNSKLLKISFNNSDSTQNMFAIIDDAKKLVSNLSEKNYITSQKKIRYKTQNEVNSTVYQASFLATIDKIINKLSEVKKVLVNQKWQAKRQEKINLKPDVVSSAVKKGVVKPVENYVLPKHLIRQIENLWQELKAIEDLGLANKLQKKDTKFIITERGSTAFQFVNNGKSILMDKNVNKHGIQYRFVIKKDKVIEESCIITENGLIVKNTLNGHIPNTPKLKFVVDGEGTNELLANVVKNYNKIKNFSQKYRKDVETQIKRKKFEKVLKAELNTDNKEKTVCLTEVKEDLKNSIEELDNTIIEIKKDFGVIYKFNEVVENIKLRFKKFFEKIVSK